MNEASPRRRWLSFTLSGMMVAITAIALSLGWWINSARQQQAALAAIRIVDPNPNIVYESEQDTVPTYGFGRQIRWPRDRSVIEEKLGRDFADDVVAVAFGEGASATSSELDRRYAFKKIASLRRLNQLVPNVEVRDEDVLYISQLPQLARIEFGVKCPHLTDDSLKTLSHMPRLDSLAIRDAPISDQGLFYLRSTTQLKSLSLGKIDPFSRPVSSFQISDEGIASLAALTNLEELDLNSPDVTGNGLKHLSGLKRLKRLRLQCPRLADVDLKYLASLTNLESFEIVETQIDGTGFKQLAGLPKLAWLCLEGPNVADEAIPYLAQLPELHSVMLYHTQVTASGLEGFRSATNLKQIGLIPAVSGDTKRLKLALPNCSILNGGKPL